MSLTIRPLRAEDLPAAERITAHAYHLVDQTLTARSLPVPALRSPERGTGWIARTTHLLATDPGGCWAAEASGELVGVVVSFRRELMWLLASYAVDPSAQGQGVGRQLLERALNYGSGCLRGMFNSSADPKAVRLYRTAGFDLHPTMSARGVVDRSAVPVDLIARVRDGRLGDRDLLDSLDRRCRGAAHGPDHEVLADQFRLVVAERASGSGYAYFDEAGSPVVVAASDRRTAAAVTWASLASGQPGAAVNIAHITAANQWALDVALAAGLAIGQTGYLALRHHKPPAPYIGHGSLM